IAQAEFKLGAGERDFINSCASNTLLPVRRFLEGDMKTIQRERKVLNTKRLDLDAAKSRLRKAKSVKVDLSIRKRNRKRILASRYELYLTCAEMGRIINMQIPGTLIYGSVSKIAD
ncbi:hypothetical protein WUBG_10829, partial [Wuchereria bancrofti]